MFKKIIETLDRVAKKVINGEFMKNLCKGGIVGHEMLYRL